MRYYRRADERVLDFANPRLPFFLFGPFYLAWRRLWLEALAMALGTGLLVHGLVRGVAASTGTRGRLDVAAVLEAFQAVKRAADLGLSADEAFGGLVAATMPFYVAGFAVIAIVSVLTWWLPAYLDWRFLRQGWIRLAEEEADRQPAIYGL